MEDTNNKPDANVGSGDELNDAVVPPENDRGGRPTADFVANDQASEQRDRD
jgi:hypothetical protein